jgi:transposase InsO family protein
MPWKERSAMEEKTSFIMEWQADGVTVAELCRSFGISRTLGYSYIRRFKQGGWKGLEQQSRAPHRVWNKTSLCVERLIVGLRKKYPRYGAVTIHGLIGKSLDASHVPSVATIDVILRRNGLVKKRRRVHRIRAVHPLFHAPRPNSIWSVDFKGEFRMGNGRYCYPLTVMDSHSMYVLAVVGMHKPTYEGARAVFEALFEQYGLPEQIHSDNGEPFASALGLSRLSRLAVWFMELGIMPVYSDPAHPEQNGRHERMHRELKADTTKPPAYSLGWQQRKFDEFRRRYNEAHPRDVLEQATPQELYYRSAKSYDGEIEPWRYPDGIVVKYVCRNGAMRWGAGKWVMVSTTLIGRYIGLDPIAQGKWRVYFRNVLLGYLDEKEMRILDSQGRLKRNVKSVKDVHIEV